MCLPVLLVVAFEVGLVVRFVMVCICLGVEVVCLLFGFRLCLLPFDRRFRLCGYSCLAGFGLLIEVSLGAVGGVRPALFGLLCLLYGLVLSLCVSFGIVG